MTPGSASSRWPSASRFSTISSTLAAIWRGAYGRFAVKPEQDQEPSWWASWAPAPQSWLCAARCPTWYTSLGWGIAKWKSCLSSGLRQALFSAFGALAGGEIDPRRQCGSAPAPSAVLRGALIRPRQRSTLPLRVVVQDRDV
jgi:hypothetical protein